MKNERKQHKECRNAEAPTDARPPSGARDGPSYIVAIGGSAGGLEAFEHFFAGIPSDTGMAFVVIQHLDPNHKALIAELLQRSMAMPVQEIKEGVKVEPNHVYVIPPNTDLSIFDGRLQLNKPSAAHGYRLPVDSFLQSLAAERGDRSIAVIVSGMGTDGTQGLKAVKEVGGVIMVESPDSAKFDGMPRSAIGTGLVDYIAPIDDLPKELIAYVNHLPRLHKEISESDTQPSSALGKILRLVNTRTGHDFTLYKKSTLYRRIEKRASLHQIDGIAKYASYAEQNPEEMDALFRELLIGVTRFFRDPEAFEYLAEGVIPDLINSAVPGGSIRVWVPACSTGEEAYSLAILLRECLDKLRPDSGIKIQIFATDIDERAIEVARKGVYPANIAADVSLERLEAFFTQTDDGYVAKKLIRETVVFAPQDLTADPPFTKMDMVSCRNLLIYFGPELQRKVLQVFHYALNPNGILFLGTAEGIGTFTELFSTTDGKWRVFRRKETPASQKRLMEIPFRAPFVEATKFENLEGEATVDVKEALRRTLLERYAPPSVVVTADGDIVLVSGRTGKYLEPAEGSVSWSIGPMAREGLRLELPAAIHRAAAHKTVVTLKGLNVRTNGDYQRVDVTVSPLAQPGGTSKLFVVTFEDVIPPETADTGALLPSEPDARNEGLEKELAYTKERLQTTLEEIESTSEELKSANEELQSTNEELQSTNEELTTSKEELQSLNEELTTLNTELQSKVDDLSALNNDIVNLMNSTQLATIFLDGELRVKRYTPAVVGTFNLRSMDVGRPITDITQSFLYETIEQDVTEVLRTLVAHEQTVQSKDGHWFIMRILPYRTLDNVIDGVVVTFTNVTDMKRLESALRESESRFRTLVDSMDDIVFTLDCEQRHEAVFGRWLDRHGLTPEQFIGKTAGEVLGSDETDLREEASRLACAGESVMYEWSAQVKGDPRQIQTSLSPMYGAEGTVVGMVGVGRDVTERRRAEDLSRALNEINAEIVSSMDREHVLSTAVTKASAALGVSAGNVAVREEQRWVVRYVSGTSSLPVGHTFTEDDVPFPSLLMKTRGPVAIGDATSDERVPHSLVDTYGVKAILDVPLVAGGETIGVLSLVSTLKPVGFTDVDVDFAEKLGVAVSLTLNNIRLYEEELQAHERLQQQHDLLQRALIPANPQAGEGYKVASRFIAGAAGEQVGGDFYDVFRTEDGELAIVIGDVAGKGVESASLAAATRSTIRAFAYDQIAPGQALTHTNAVILGQGPISEQFVTVFLAVLDEENGKLRYSGGGHPPAVIQRADGSVEKLEIAQLPIGVTQKTVYHEGEARLEAGDKLLMYTDGISEAHSGPAMYDIEGIEATLREQGGSTPEETIEALFKAATEAGGGSLSDDAAVVIVERDSATNGERE